MSLGMILALILAIAVAGVLPLWKHSQEWGYGPAGGLGLVAMILAGLIIIGVI